MTICTDTILIISASSFCARELCRPIIASIGVGAGKFWGCERFLPEFPQNYPKNFWATFYAIFMWFWAPFFQTKALWASFLLVFLWSLPRFSVNFRRIITYVAQISTDFALIFRDFARIFTKSEHLGMHLHPYLLHHWLHPMLQ